MKIICKYCAKYYTPKGKTCGFCTGATTKPPTEFKCQAYQPRTMLEADSRDFVICYVRYCVGRRSYAPSECDMFIRDHIQDPGIQAAIPVMVQDLAGYVGAEEKDTSEHRDHHLQLWKDLLAFLKDNQKGDKA